MLTQRNLQYMASAKNWLAGGNSSGPEESLRAALPCLHPVIDSLRHLLDIRASAMLGATQEAKRQTLCWVKAEVGHCQPKLYTFATWL